MIYSIIIIINTNFLRWLTFFVNGISQQYILMIFMLFRISVSTETRSSDFLQFFALLIDIFSTFIQHIIIKNDCKPE